MMERPARIIEISPDRMLLSVKQEEACKACATREACHGKEKTMSLPIQSGFKPGDELILSLEDDSFRLAAVLAYLVPVIGLLAGSLIGQGIVNTDLSAMSGALTGLFGGLFSARMITHFFQGRLLQPEILACPLPPTSRNREP